MLALAVFRVAVLTELDDLAAAFAVDGDGGGGDTGFEACGEEGAVEGVKLVEFGVEGAGGFVGRDGFGLGIHVEVEEVEVV